MSVSDSGSSEDLPLSKLIEPSVNELDEYAVMHNNAEIEIHEQIDRQMLKVSYSSSDFDEGGKSQVEVGNEQNELTRPNMVGTYSDDFLNKLLDGVMSRTERMFSSLNQKIENTNQKIDSLTEANQNIDVRLNNIEIQIREVDSKVETEIRGVKTEMKAMEERLDKKFNSYEQRCNEKLEQTVSKCSEMYEVVNNRAGSVEEKLTSVIQRVESVEKVAVIDKGVLTEVKGKLDKVEHLFYEQNKVAKRESEKVNNFLAEQNSWKSSFRVEINNQLTTELASLDENVDKKFKLSKSELVEVRNELCKEIRELRGEFQGSMPKNSGVCSKSVDSGLLMKQTSSIAEMYLIEFRGENEQYVHPMYFLKFAKKFSEVSENSWETNKLVLLKYLKGPANQWARDVIMFLHSFDDFESAFKRQYWSKNIQRHFENDLLGKGDFIQGKTDLCLYVLRYFDKNSYLDRPYTMSEFISEIARHLPSSIGLALATAKEVNSKNDLELLLKQLTNIAKSKARTGQEHESDVRSGNFANEGSQNRPRNFDNGRGSYNRFRGQRGNMSYQQRQNNGGYRSYDGANNDNQPRPSGSRDEGQINEK